MKGLSWKLVLTLLIGIPVINIVAGYIGRSTAERMNAKEAATNRVVSPSPTIRTLVSSQDAEGFTQAQMNLDFLKNLEAYTVHRVTVKTEEKLAASGHPNLKAQFSSEATYVESGSTKLALIRLSSTDSRQIFIVGIVGKELRRVLCFRESEESIPIASGPCAEKIKETFGISFGG